MKRLISALRVAGTLAMISWGTHALAQENESPTDTKQQEQVVQLVQAANESIKAEDYDKAIEKLKQAIQVVPDNMDLQYKLATTLMAADRMQEMWSVLRQAAFKAPGHPDLARALIAYWKMYDNQGLFNTNHETIDTVFRVLGEPDRVIQGPDRDRFLYGFIGIESKHSDRKIFRTLDLRGITPEHLNPKDFVVLEMDGRGRQVGHRTTNRESTTAEFVLPGERVQDWTQLVSVQRLHGMANLKAPVRQIAENMMDSLLKQEPQRQFRILEANDDSVVYEWKIPGNSTQRPQHELARLIRGRVDVHRIAFVVKQAEMDEALRDQWLSILRAAKLESVSQSSPGQAGNQSATSKTNETAWRLGDRLSIAVFAHAQRKEELAKRNLVGAFEIARELQIEMPAPFQLTDDTLANVTRAVGYLFEDTLPVLRQRITEPQVANYEVAARVNTLAMICANRELCEKNMSKIVPAFQRSGLPQDLLSPLSESIQRGAAPDQIRAAIQEFQAQVARHYDSQDSHAQASPAKKSSEAQPTNRDRSPMKKPELPTNRVLTLHGSKIGEITSAGEVWLGGVKAGDITANGEIWVAGDKEGEITTDGEVWKAGEKIGDITDDGEVWLEGNQVGSIESNGDVWKEGSNVGHVAGANARHAAIVLFFGFFDIEN